MKADGKRVWTAVSIIFIGILVSVPAQTVFSQVVIPEGSIITSAELTIYADFNAVGQTVHLYRITEDWSELGVTWNGFGGSYDNNEIGSFDAAFGANVVNVTSLVQDWVDGIYPNFGFFLTLGPNTHIRYFSSEHPTAATRPKLEIVFTDPSGFTGNVVIQRRPTEGQDGVADAYIWEPEPSTNFGYNPWLYTGLYVSGEKKSLVRFFFTIAPPGPGTGTQGYWRNHPRAWPVDGIEIGGAWYTKSQAIREMKKPVRTDKTRSMFRQLVAAKLNVEIGNDDSCIAVEIAAADQWMNETPLGSGVRANSPEWDEGEPLHFMLNEYNNGRLDCANSRDD